VRVAALQPQSSGKEGEGAACFLKGGKRGKTVGGDLWEPSSADGGGKKKREKGLIPKKKGGIQKDVKLNGKKRAP